MLYISFNIFFFSMNNDFSFISNFPWSSLKKGKLTNSWEKVVANNSLQLYLFFALPFFFFTFSDLSMTSRSFNFFFSETEKIARKEKWLTIHFNSFFSSRIHNYFLRTFSDVSTTAIFLWTSFFLRNWQNREKKK